MNIVLLIADQLRYDCVSGEFPVNTPNLDRLASEGVFFKHAFTPMPVCAPARQCLASGKMADSFGGFWNYDMKGLPCKSLITDGSTWSNHLEQSGYSTAFLGKWHTSETQGPQDFGYTHSVNNSIWAKHVEEKYPGYSYKKGFDGEESFLALEDSHPHFMAKKAVEFMTDFADAPFFIRLDYNDPHLPCRPSKPFSEMYKKEDAVPWASFGDKFIGKPYIQKQMVKNWGNENRSWDEWSETVARYYAMISQVDDSAGMILNAIDENGLRDNTLVIFTSDHGDTCGGHGMMDKHYILYDDNCRVPLIIRCPGGAAGLKSDAFVSNMLDIPPTIEEICGLTPSGVGIEERHGMSLLPILKGKEQPERDDFAVSSSNGQQFGFYSNRTIRTAKWRYVWNLTDVDELYNHDNDPGELNNLAAEPGYADILRELRMKLYNKLISYNDPFACGWVKTQLTEGSKY